MIRRTVLRWWPIVVAIPAFVALVVIAALFFEPSTSIMIILGAFFTGLLTVAIFPNTVRKTQTFETYEHMRKAGRPPVVLAYDVDETVLGSKITRAMDAQSIMFMGDVARIFRGYGVECIVIDRYGTAMQCRITIHDDVLTVHGIHNVAIH